MFVVSVVLTPYIGDKALYRVQALNVLIMAIL